MPVETFGELHKEEKRKYESWESAKERYNFYEIWKLKESVTKLVEHLKPAIDRGDYDTLISDDASGRIPTLILRNIFQKRLKNLHPEWKPEERRAGTKTFFIKGGRNVSNDQALNSFFTKIKPEIKKKILLVTEYLESGVSMIRILNVLDKIGFDVDIAALVIRYNSSGYKALTDAHQLFIGQELGGLPPIWSRESLSGVTMKHDPEMRKFIHYSAHAKRSHDKPTVGQQDLIAKARDDAKTLADEVYQKVWGSN